MSMPVNDRVSGPFATTGGETVFGYDFKLLAAEDLALWRRRGGATERLILGIHYSVAGVGAANGGTVTLLTGAAAIADDTYVLEGDRPHRRTADLQGERVFSAVHVNAEFDALQAQIQELGRRLDRALTRSRFDLDAGTPLELPPAEPGQLLGLDSNGGLDFFAPGGGSGGGGGGGGLDPLPIDDGGTGATDVATAQTNLGIVSAAGIPAVVAAAFTASPTTYRAALDLGDLATLDRVATGQVDDNAITLAKQAPGTPNFYQGWDANGDPAALSPVALVKVRALGRGTSFSGGRTRHWVTDDNALWGVGSNTHLANGYLSTSTAVPTKVAFNVPPATIVKVVCSSTSVYVLDSAGRVFSFGGNAQGQLGHGDTSSRALATRIEWLVSNGVIVADVFVTGDAAGGLESVYAVGTDGRGYAWGSNATGQLGVGNIVDSSIPVLLTAVIGIARFAPASNINGHCMLVTSTGALYATGANGVGQLGLGDTTQRTVWTAVPGITNAADLACASSATGGSTLLRRSNSTIWATGLNGVGQLGLGDSINRSAFVQIPGYGAVSAVGMTTDAVTATAFARSSNGQVHTWGHNAAGQCGTNTTINVLTPALPASAFQGYAVKVVSSGVGAQTGLHVLDQQGRLWGAGYAAHGNLGTGQLAAINTYFVEVLGIAGHIVDVDGVGSATAGAWGLNVLYDDGRVAVTGDNSAGQLGLGTGSGDTNVLTEVTLLARAGPRGIKGDTGDPGATGPNTALDYAFDALTADIDPTAGKLRLNSGTWGTASWLYVSKSGRNGETLGTVIASRLASTSAIRAHLRLFPLANRAIYLEADVAAAAVDGGTYWKIPLSGVVASAAMPGAAAVMAVEIDRTGDTGAPTSGAVMHTSTVSGAVPTNVAFHLNRAFDFAADGGAIGDDATINDTAFGRLANALTDGRECIIRPGIYRLDTASAAITPGPKGLKLLGQGGGSILKRMTNLTVPLLQILGGAPVIADLMLEYANGTTTASGEHEALRIKDGRGPRITNVTAKGFWYAGIEDRDGEDSVFTNCRALGAVNRGFYRQAIDADSVDVRFLSCFADGEGTTTYGYNENQAAARVCVGGGFFNGGVRRVTHQGIAICGLGSRAIGNFVKDVSHASGVGVLVQAPNGSVTQRCAAVDNVVIGAATGIADSGGLYTLIQGGSLLITTIGINKVAANEGQTTGVLITSTTNGAIAVNITGSATVASTEERIADLRIRFTGTSTTGILTIAAGGGNAGSAGCTIDKSSIVMAGVVTPYTLGGTGHFTPTRLAQYPAAANFPVTGEADVLYVALATSTLHRWTGSAYAPVGGGSSAFTSQVTVTTAGIPLVLDSTNNAQPIQMKTAGVTRSFFGAAAATPLYVQNPVGLNAVLFADNTNGGTIAAYPKFAANATGSPAEMFADGSDANIDLRLVPKGTGRVRFGAFTAGGPTVTGYIEIKADNGTIYKIAVGT